MDTLVLTLMNLQEEIYYVILSVLDLSHPHVQITHVTMMEHRMWGKHVMEMIWEDFPVLTLMNLQEEIYYVIQHVILIQDNVLLVILYVIMVFSTLEKHVTEVF